MSNVLTNQLVVEQNGVGNVVRITMRSEELGTKLTRGIVLIGLEKLYFYVLIVWSELLVCFGASSIRVPLV